MSKGVCPVCNGSGKMPISNFAERFKTHLAGYDKETDTLSCNNCGGQRMYGSPTGMVNLREDGTPCTHAYTSETVGRCLTQYTCKHCGDRYQIDSGD